MKLTIMMKVAALIYFITICFTLRIFAQDKNEFHPIQKLFEVNKFEVSFMYYSSGNGVSDNGINLLIHNRNQYDIVYSFYLIFKSKRREKIERIEGSLKKGEKRTGSNSNLFFLPFEDGSRITHLGATKVRVRKIEPQS